MAKRKGRGPARLVEPVSLLGLSLGDVLLELMRTDEGRREGPAPDVPAAAGAGPTLRLLMPDGRVEAEAVLGGFLRPGRAGGPARPRVVTRREGPGLACKLYRVEGGKALYAGALKAAGARAFVGAAPGGAFRYRNAALRRMTAEELAAAVDPGLVYAYDLLGTDEG